MNDYEPQSTGNQARRSDRNAGDQAALNSGTFLLPIHDYPARIEHGRVISRLVGDSVPGPELAVEHQTVGETRKMGLGREEFSLPPAP